MAAGCRHVDFLAPKRLRRRALIGPDGIGFGDASKPEFWTMRPLLPALPGRQPMECRRQAAKSRMMAEMIGPIGPTRVGGFSCRMMVYLAALCGVSGTVAGCGKPRRVEPLSVANPYLGAATIAVAPAVNVSGSNDFDPSRVADLMASELGFAERITVIPVSRVLGAMAVLGTDQISSPHQATQVADLVGADAILVFAVTEYDPYDPPRIGITAQLYGVEPSQALGGPEPQSQVRLLAQTQRVFSGAHADVVGEIVEYAARRDADNSPFGWRRYVVSQQHFMRFCCHATVKSLLSGDRFAVVAGESGKER